MRKVVMNYQDYKSEHKRLAKVLKGAKTAAAARELRLQRQEKPKVVSMPKMMKMVPYRGEEY